MNTKIGTSFGLALLVAIAAIATMFALGMFSASGVSADHDSTHVSSTQVGEVIFNPGSSSVNAKTSWDVTFGVSSALVQGTDTVTITFPAGVVVPATIDKTRISAGSLTDLVPLTSDPTVSGQSVTLTLPATDPGGGPAAGMIINQNATVSFSQLAGLANPAKSGAAGTIAAGTAGKVKTSNQTTNANVTAASITANTTFATTISLGGLTTQVQGGTVTVTVGGLTPGLQATLSGGSVTGSGVVGSDRKVVITGTKTGTAGTVTATDTATLTATSGSISVKAELTATATGKAGDNVVLTGKNYTSGSGNNIASFASITFGGNALTTNQDVTDLSSAVTHTDRDADESLDDFKVTILVPSNATKGVNQIKVTDAGGASATANIDVIGRSVTITPPSGPPGTVVTIVGEGFPASRPAASANTVSIAPIFGSTTKTNLFTDGSGNLPGSDQFTIPAAATTSVITLTVSITGADSVAATGTAKFTVTSRVLTAVPTSGPKGTKILLTGTKFTASGTVTANTVTVGGASTTHAVANLTSSGDVPGITLAIPSGAAIGSNTISLSDTASTPLTGTTTFTVTVPTITAGLTSATMGQSVPVDGAGWVPNSSVTITLTSASVTVATKVATADGSGAFSTTVTIPSTVGVGPKTVTFTAADATTFGNTATAQNLAIPKPAVALSESSAEVGATIEAVATGFPPQSGLSTLTIGGADVREAGVVATSDTEGGLSVNFVVPGVTGSNIVTVTIGSTTVSTSISVIASKAPAAAATTAPSVIFADLIANEDNLVRVWRFDNATQGWNFFDPRPAFEAANTLAKSGAGDIVWINVVAEQEFQGSTLFEGWNLRSLS